MTLYALKREYDERRQALIDKLQTNQLEPELQHQLYGAVKEIEHFLETIDLQIKNEQQLNFDLERDKPAAMGTRTKKAAGKVRRGTRKVFKEKIPGAAKKVVSGPGRYFKRKRELKRFKKQVKEEVKARMNEFADMDSHPGGMSGTITDVDLSDSPKEHVSFRVEKETDFAPDEPQTTPKKRKK